MNTVLSRLWIVANTVSGDILYSSCQYSQAKNMLDFFKRHRVPLPLSLLRYDLSRSYWDEFNKVVETDIQHALAAAVRLCKHSSVISTTNNKPIN